MKKTPVIYVLDWFFWGFLIVSMITAPLFGRILKAHIAGNVLLKAHVFFGTAFIVLLCLKIYWIVIDRNGDSTKRAIRHPKTKEHFNRILYLLVIVTATLGIGVGFGGFFSFAFLHRPFPMQFYINSPSIELHGEFGFIVIALLMGWLFVMTTRYLVSVCRRIVGKKTPKKALSQQ